MCDACYEKYASEPPAPVTDPMRELALLIRAQLQRTGAGGALHNVIDDWNLEDHSVRWCLGLPPDDDGSNPVLEPGDREIGEGLLALSLPERAEVLRMAQERGDR